MTTTIAIARKLTWEEKWQLLLQVNPGANVRMREPGNWYVCSGMEHAHGATMLVGDYGNGSSPREAIESHWNQYADGRPMCHRGEWRVWTNTGWHPTKDPRE